MKVISVPTGSGDAERHVATLRDAKAFGAELSPDRRYISYTVNRNAVNNVCVTELSTGREKCLTSNDDADFYYSGVTWAPDSKSVLYSRQTGRMQIALITRRSEDNH